MSQVVPLDLMRTGESGQIVDLCGDERLISQLAEKGMRQGSTIVVLQEGNPLVCLVDRTRLTLRADGLVEILVALEAAPASAPTVKEH
ncbi:FeoA domain protein [Planctomycetes bacterium Pan216]|uniref:FeoA domain protein n=1 Tax=Kolteria novifilia TaxID=2527975 RepID=A0A518AX08_9BACT|nr:FeoA domain protein [Planctomycetes bacterium Pan216]